MVVKKSQKKAAETGAKEPAKKVLAIPHSALTLMYKLLDVQLHGAQCRARNKLSIIVRNKIHFLEDERIRLLEDRADKDKDGVPAKKMSEAGEMEYVVTPEKMESFRKEFQILMDQKLEIDLADGMKQVIAYVRPLVIESKLPLGTVDGYVYEELCKAFEAV